MSETEEHRKNRLHWLRLAERRLEMCLDVVDPNKSLGPDELGYMQNIIDQGKLADARREVARLSVPYVTPQERI